MCHCYFALLPYFILLYHIHYFYLFILQVPLAKCHSKYISHYSLFTSIIKTCISFYSFMYYICMYIIAYTYKNSMEKIEKNCFVEEMHRKHRIPVRWLQCSKKEEIEREQGLESQYTKLSAWTCISFWSVDLGYILHRQQKGVDDNDEVDKRTVKYSQSNRGEESFDMRLCPELSFVTNCIGQRNVRAIYDTRLTIIGTSYFRINMEWGGIIIPSRIYITNSLGRFQSFMMERIRSLIFSLIKIWYFQLEMRI